MPGHPRPTISWKGLLILAGAAWGCGGADDQSAPASSFLLTDVRIVDGTGAAAYQGAVRVHDGSIIETGDLSPRESEAVVDGAGLVLAPGFIDTHSHHDGGLADLRDATGAVSQGITTIVAGQDG
ncbi:MAG: hypothetical protein OEZ37_09090, partial [Gemmatimonadota bacterium]|nr:hypothetical protein [Gemmatimonadota bacterium]